jgi:hypothetical protein
MLSVLKGAVKNIPAVPVFTGSRDCTLRHEMRTGDDEVSCLDVHGLS